ncbi:MAG: cupin domain-containing protein [Candidatus Cryosericum sp.]|nr:cupin domain-containing protein [bacterium]
MIVIAAEDVEAIPVTENGAHGTTIRWLLKDTDGVPTFAMRQFVVEPGGATPRHAHAWEHEIYVLKGICTAFCEGETRRVGPDHAIYIEPNAIHSFTNEESEPLVFLCMIPIG